MLYDLEVPIRGWGAGLAAHPGAGERRWLTLLV